MYTVLTTEQQTGFNERHPELASGKWIIDSDLIRQINQGLYVKDSVLGVVLVYAKTDFTKTRVYVKTTLSYVPSTSSDSWIESFLSVFGDEFVSRAKSFSAKAGVSLGILAIITLVVLAYLYLPKIKLR
jgi:hypothetical protein